MVQSLINKNCFIKFTTLLQPYACLIHARLTTLAWSLLNVFKRGCGLDCIYVVGDLYRALRLILRLGES